MVRKQEHLLQHFKPEEKYFAERMLDKVEQVVNSYSWHLTPFLNPREAFIAESLARKAGLQVFSSANIYPAESVRLILAPDYYQLAAEDFEICLLGLVYARKFHTLSHAQILGSLINQLGIKRQLLGDILLNEAETQVLADQKISSLLVENVTKISRVSVSWKRLEASQLILPDLEEKEKTLLASSWRLDTLIALAYGLSRQEAAKLVTGGQVKVNHQPIHQVAYNLEVKDLVSCRGYGRFIVKDHHGQTRQGKLRLTLSKIGGK